jgi:Arc/MetJ-type ribon-helix-helix transcriptional regulator
MTKVSKMTISLPQGQAEQVREAIARGDASSVSGYISAALAAVMAAPASENKDTLAGLVADMITEDGPPSAEAYAWADKVLGLTEVTD